MSVALNLSDEAARFQRWAESHFRTAEQRSGEWETEYPDWERLYASVRQFLSSTDRELTAGEEELVLYAIARDNECERIIEELEAYPTIAVQIARAALSHPDSDARWQSAVLLGRLRSDEAMALLDQFASDTDEYVRRRARSAKTMRDA